ncbi:chemoreceptor glutamine deamidase CheD [Sneathiella sp. P13V-1]|uniref:chemoreceptor glutamine deamidase CheD n=1 Tax=Sneathiella sp. P13V-1 TaxID=2697366 RepID=UPI00187B9CCD|nr:chemoreceptor glutamine deamidase CheD [Sneathiella sp. P13V-1]MBE7637715.1 chemoreceptor glutamine deamidase CheD [Sneathiella sp. P13V-1]
MNHTQTRPPEKRFDRKLDPFLTTTRRKYFDPKWNRTVVRVHPGDHYICKGEDEMIVTILGSCVSACIRDPKIGVGGMNHFMLPESDTGNWGTTSANMRYGNYAMETLINDILKAGGQRERLEVKLFGGGNVTPGSVLVGDNNGRFALNYLKYEGLTPLACDLGGPHPRRIHYDPITGKVDRLLLRRKDDLSLLKEENEYRRKLPKQASGSGEIDLF